MWSVVSVFVFMSVFIVPSILAHSAAAHPEKTFLRKTLFAIYLIYIADLVFVGCISNGVSEEARWYSGVTILFPLLALLCLIRQVRNQIPKLLTPLNKLASLDFVFGNSSRKYAAEGAAATFHDASMLKQIFLPDSLPHLNGLVLFLLSLGICFQNLKTSGFAMPALGSLPEARHADMALAGDCLSTLLVVACGVGIFISRKPKEVLFRLSMVKPGWRELVLGVALCAFTFFYDYVWSLFTHNAQGSGALPAVMRAFNEGTYLGHGDAGTALVLAIAIGLVAGLEEEIATRGALQPVFGIVPAAFLHAALHTQFSSSPLFMIQIFGWSAMMGTVKYYTNTTTTIIAHGLFNLIACFLIGFNP